MVFDPRENLYIKPTAKPGSSSLKRGSTTVFGNTARITARCATGATARSANTHGYAPLWRVLALLTGAKWYADGSRAPISASVGSRM